MEVVLADNLLLSATVLFMPILYFVGAFSLITALGLGRWVFPIGLLLFVLVIYILHRREGYRRILLFLSLFLLLFAFASFITNQGIDLFWDSRDYHARAMISLLGGFNPFYTPTEWVSLAYPAGHWIMSSSLILWTNSFAASYSFSLLSIFGAFVCSWRFIALLSGVSRVWRLVISGLLSFANPISLTSLFNHYTDALLASVLLSVFMLMLLYVEFGFFSSHEKKRGWRYDIPPHLHVVYIIFILIFLINIKFTGFLYGGVLGVFALLYGFAKSRSSELYRSLRRLAGIGCVAAILGFFVFGFFPYVTNTIEKGNPFASTLIYDEQGEFQGSVVSENFVPEFYENSYYERWWVSLFSKNVTWREPAPLAPFSSIKPNSFGRGFGSFFSGALLLCLTLVFFIRGKGFWLVIGGVIASLFATDSGYFFRVAPQNWWLPLLFVLFSFAYENKSGLRGDSFKRVASATRGHKLMAVLIVSCLLWVSLGTFAQQVRNTVNAKIALSDMEEEGGWYVTRDTETSVYPNYSDYFFNYYVSGFSNVNLPTLAECPAGASRKLLAFGLAVCRP